MSNLLHLFVKPPYADWTLIHGYGTDPVDPSVMHTHLLLEKTGTAEFVAAVTGKLSIRPPRGGTLDANEEIVLPDQDEPLPEAVNIYLHTWPTTLAINPAFRDRAQEINDVSGFGYLNVASSSLEAGLAEVLDKAVIPGGSLTRSQIVERFVRGSIDLLVSAGHVIGQASSEGAPAGSVRLGFAALTNCGPLDPPYVYDWMREYVEDGQPDLDAFLVLAPKGWPVIDPDLGVDDAVTLTESTLYPWHVLHTLKTRYGLEGIWRDDSGTKRSLWRIVGDNQKSLWRARLLKRVGHPEAGSSAPPFEFDDLDWQNLFQLESVVEFYANFDDPWATGAVPRSPNAADYVSVDFLNLSGETATASGNVLTLDGNPALSRVHKFYNTTRSQKRFRDIIFLETDTARPTRLYKITDVDDVADTVTLDAIPTLTGGTSKWEIKLRTVGVIIDCFGGRSQLKGVAATAAGSVLTLDRDPELSKVNKNFDTIYLPSDTARPSRSYRISDFNNDAKTVTVDAAPVLEGDSSRWHIPSGISGELAEVGNIRGPGGARGFDHYDGFIFVLQNGEIHRKIPFSSYTSRKWDPNDPIVLKRQYCSSIRGNRGYDFMSFRSGSDYKNYCIMVTDPGANYDGVREARFYFLPVVTDDTAPVGTTPDILGKTEIRIHQGELPKVNNGSGSAGCVISPSFQDVRDAFIDRYQDEYVALNGLPRDRQVDKARAKDLTASRRLWALTGNAGLTDANWNNKLIGTFWVIRPDERPVN